ncbi:MAG: ABC transporter substrate-binding protein [Acidimicrobiales bacterium]
MLILLLSVPFSLSGATPISSTNENARTLDLSLPGPFNGCTYLDAGANGTTHSILDLTLPSAFLTGSNGTLLGENGPIASAELMSLAPETVVYTLQANLKWSNGAPFSGVDLVNWWKRARTLTSVTSDGYRDIGSMKVSGGGLVVTAVFAHNNADWNLLFRDVEEPGAAPGCSVRYLATRPSLGAYFVTSATPRRVVLQMNRSWPLDPNRFGRIVITNTSTLPTKASVNYAGYAQSVSRAKILSLSAQTVLSSHIGSSDGIEEMTFSPRGSFTPDLAVREALSWAVNRQAMIDSLFGAVTFSPSVAASAIYSQGQQSYPGTSGSSIPVQSTTTVPNPSTNGLADCVDCAIDVLRENGFRRVASGWISKGGIALRVRLGVGTSPLDHHVAAQVVRDWKAIGIRTIVRNEPGETRAALAAATGNVDVAIFLRPTTTSASYAARSWAGPSYLDTYPSGVRLPIVTSLYDQASQTFNPVSATSIWLHLDQVLMTNFWVRPFFTAPSLVIWSNTLSVVEGSATVPGFVDQVPTWSITPNLTKS